MKNILTTIKATITLAAILLTLTAVNPINANASTVYKATVIESTPDTITVQADNENIYSFDNEDADEDRWMVGENMKVTIDDNNQLIQARPIPLAERNKNQLQVTNTYINNSGNFIAEYSDNSWSCVNDAKQLYVLQLDSLGDYDIQANSQHELSNIINIYKSHIENPSDTCNTIKDIKEVDRYTDNNGMITICFNNGSFATIDEAKGIYNFTPAETLVGSNEGYSVECNDMSQLNNCINTYKSIKLNGWY